jgi:cation-transporting ATPase E
MIAEHSANNLCKWLTYTLTALALTGVTLLVLFYFRRRVRPTEPPKTVALPRPITHLTVTGLSEAEAAARLEPGQDNLIQRRPRRTRRQMIREGALTIFNLNLVGLGFVQVLLGRPLDALITVGILLFNIGVAVFQEEFARYRIQGLQQTVRSQTTVIRDGRPRSIDPDQIVVGDAVSAGPGDQIIVDGVVGQGQLTVDESLLSGDSTHLPKQPGDPLYAGSICLHGQAIYQAEKTGQDRLIVERLQEGSDSKEELTPIEQIMNRVMSVLLVIVILLAAVLVTRYFRLDATPYWLPAIFDWMRPRLWMIMLML